MFRGSVKSTGYPLHSPVSPFTSTPVRHRVPSGFNWTLRHGSTHMKTHSSTCTELYLGSQRARIRAAAIRSRHPIGRTTGRPLRFLHFTVAFSVATFWRDFLRAENAPVQCWRVQGVMVAENSESYSFVHLVDTQAGALHIATSVFPGLKSTAHFWCQG